MLPLLVLERELYTFQLLINNKSKECLKVVKDFQTHSHNILFKITSLELTIERSYQTHSKNIHFKMTELVRRFSRKRDMSSSRIHCCYIIIGTEIRDKHILKQDELFYCAIISSGLKEKKISVLFSSLRTPDPSLLLGNPGLLINLPRNWLSFPSF